MIANFDPRRLVFARQRCFHFLSAVLLNPLLQIGERRLEITRRLPERACAHPLILVAADMILVFGKPAGINRGEYIRGGVAARDIFDQSIVLETIGGYAHS